MNSQRPPTVNVVLRPTSIYILMVPQPLKRASSLMDQVFTHMILCRTHSFKLQQYPKEINIVTLSSTITLQRLWQHEQGMHKSKPYPFTESRSEHECLSLTKKVYPIGNCLQRKMSFLQWSLTRYINPS